MRRPTALLAVLAIAALALASLSAIASSATSKPATVKTGTSSLGRIVVDGQSHTLYVFQKDKGAKSACSGVCAQNWPPLLTKGAPKAGPSAKASLLGTTKRADGTTQVTYNGHPLYTFAGDGNKPGSTNGQGFNAFGALWYVVGTNGNAITTPASSSTSSGGGGLGY
jgi:predicted lipoprotein with Yx(FWY)xxD motif